MEVARARHKRYLKPDSQLLIFHARNSISPFGCTFLLLLRQLKGLLMAVLAGDIQKPGQKTAAWSKAASVEKNLRAKW